MMLSKFKKMSLNPNDIIDNFRKTSEFYSLKLKGINTFKDVPFTSKKDLITSQKKHPPLGNFTDFSKTIYQTYRTSGTSANPLLLCFTKKDIEQITDIGRDCYAHSGMGNIGNEEVVINCLNLSMWAGGFFDSQSITKTGVQVLYFGTGNTSELVKLIMLYNKKFKVSVHCTPSYLPVIEKKLMDEFGKTPRSLKLHAFYLGGEGGVQNNLYRESLIKKWNCKVFNANYGMSEVCSIMASASDDNILRFSPLFIKQYYLELLDISGVFIPFSELRPDHTGDLIVTSLKKECQPLLRYHTKEKIKIHKINKSEIFFEVLGRSDDMIVYKGINIFPEEFRGIVSKNKKLTGRYKLLIQQKNNLVENIRLVCEINVEMAGIESEIIKTIQTDIKNQLHLKIPVELSDNFNITGNKLKMIEYI
jgi:phenylacetate-CoA ligase